MVNAIADGPASADMRERMRAIMTLDRAAWVLEYDGHRVLWGVLADGVLALEQALAAAQVAPDAPVAVVGRNRPGQVMALMGILSGMHPLVILNPVQPARTLAAEVSHLRLPAIVAEEGDWTAELVDAARMAGTLGLVVDPLTLALNLHPALPQRGPGPFHRSVPGTGFEIQTSGTTGAPKRLPMPLAVVQSAMEDGIRSEKGPAGLELKRSPRLPVRPRGPHQRHVHADLLVLRGPACGAVRPASTSLASRRRWRRTTPASWACCRP